MNSGVYKIENRESGKIYVGSTNNFKVRWGKHKALLRHGKHPNSHLQASWNKYGEKQFIFSILEECEVNSLLCKEQYYIDILNPAYNQTNIAGKVEMTDERRKKLSESVNRAYSEGRLQKTIKEVHQYDLKGNYMASYPSLTEAAAKTNTDLSHLSSALHGKINVAGGFVWRFYKTDKIDVWFSRMGQKLTKEPYRPKRRIKRPVLVYTENGILKFPCVKDAVIPLGCTIHQLRKALAIGRLLFKKYKVEYE
jgi:group I intron endonuclease